MKTKTPIEPPINPESRVRAAAFRLLLAHSEPIGREALVRETAIGPDQLEELLDQLDHAGWIRRDDAGNVVGSAGLSIVPDRHEIELDGRRFWTWCAYDILGIFGALAAGGRAFSPSPPSGQIIEVQFVRGRPEQNAVVLFRPDEDLMICCENVYEQWCPHSNLFVNSDLAQSWAKDHGLKGRILHLDEASDLAAEDWKPLTNGVLTRIKGGAL